MESNNLQISDGKDIKILTEKYSTWLDSIYTNIQTMTGQAVKLNWLPE